MYLYNNDDIALYEKKILLKKYTSNVGCTTFRRIESILDENLLLNHYFTDINVKVQTPRNDVIL